MSDLELTNRQYRMVSLVTGRMTKAEQERKNAPTFRDVLETRMLLDDFKVHKDIPTFTTLSELIAWRKQAIKEKLA